MPLQSQDSPLGAFLKALREEDIEFRTEWKRCAIGRLEGVPLRILPLQRVIASKRAAGRDKDLAALPVLERTLRLAKRLKARKPGTPNPPRKQRKAGSN